MSGVSFARGHVKRGRGQWHHRAKPHHRDPCIDNPTEQLLRALLLQASYTVKGEWVPTEQLVYNLLFRWFVRSLEIDDPVWGAMVFVSGRTGTGCWRPMQQSCSFATSRNATGEAG